MIFLKNLKASQLCAVQQEPSESLISAGPGSGKTRLLTSRIASFVLERDPPLSIRHDLLLLFYQSDFSFALRK